VRNVSPAPARLLRLLQYISACLRLKCDLFCYLWRTCKYVIYHSWYIWQ